MRNSTPRRSLPLVLLGLLLLSAYPVVALAQDSAGKAARLTTQTAPTVAGTCDPGLAQADLDAGNVRARLYNNGGLFWKGDSSVYEVPKGSGRNAIFASGIWMGGRIEGDLHMAAATYSNWEFWPGPLDENGDAPSDCSPFDRIYTVSVDDVGDYEVFGSTTADLRDWPVELGAPVIDGDGIEGNYDLAAGDRPLVRGDQTAWWVMNDAGGVHNTTQTPAIGMEARVTAHTYSDPGVLGNTTFYRYELAYKGDAPLEDYYFGIWTDADLGIYNDDYVGSDSTLQMGYYYNGEETDGVYGTPPALGYTLKQGLPAEDDGLDNDGDGTVDEDGEHLGLSQVLSYNNSDSPQGNPATADEYYNYLSGQWRDGEPVTYGGDGYGFSNTPAPFMYPANPGEYWSEDNLDGSGTSAVPGDRRLLMVTGPVTLQPGETVTVEYAIVFSQGASRLLSVQQLKQDAASVLGVEGPPPIDPPTEAPTLLAPADGAEGQPLDVWLRVDRSDPDVTYKTQVASDAAFAEVVDGILSPNTTYYWRARAVNAGGFGPWSEARSFTTSTFYNGNLVWSLLFEGEPAVVEVAGPGGADPCGAGAESTAGCAELGGNHVYNSANGTGAYYVASQGGVGSDETLAPYQPHDYEVRFGESSIAYHAFTTGNAVEVPFTVWDVGPLGPNEANDPADDVQLIPVLYSDNAGECSYEVGEIDTDPLGLGFMGTDRLYAYYPTTSYADWGDAVRPLVEADADGCPDVRDIADTSIDYAAARPLQREVIFTSATSIDELAGTVIRFMTRPPNQPAPSAPANEVAGVREGTTLYWTGLGPDPRVQVATSTTFSSPTLDVTLENTYANEFTIQNGLADATTYYWRVGLPGQGDAFVWSDVWSFTTATDVATEQDALPERFALHANYPNPFNPTTTLTYEVAQAGPVRLTVYDALGRQVATLVDGAQAAGRHTATFDARSLASGVYFVRMEAGTFNQTRSMLLMK